MARLEPFWAEPTFSRNLGWIGSSAPALLPHEGQLFGFANQLVGLFTTIGLVTLSLSGLVMWWRRKPEGVLGAPAPIQRLRFSGALVALLVAFGLYFPFLGGSMIIVGLLERFLLCRITATQRWLGLVGT